MFWKMAEYLGAVCSTDVNSSVTHVVTVDLGTEKARWGVDNKKFLVHPRWIEAANFRWHRLPEEDFPVTAPKEKSREKDKAVAGKKETSKDKENSAAGQKETMKDKEENAAAGQKETMKDKEENAAAGLKETMKDEEKNAVAGQKETGNDERNVAGQEKDDGKENAVATATTGPTDS
jgi:RNA polymerase II C-terminal domain phosphatase-like 3/4